MDSFKIDSHKLHYHPARVAELIDSVDDWGKFKFIKPLYAELSVSGGCNHRCTFCSVDYLGYKPNFFTIEQMSTFFQTSAAIGLKAVMFAGDGEPLLNPYIKEIVSLATLHNIDTSFTTNGVHLSRDFIDSSFKDISWIKVSMNAGTEADYASIHRTKPSDFQKVWNNLEYAVEYRRTNSYSCALGVQSLILPENLANIHQLIERAQATGLDYVVLKPYVHNIYMKDHRYEDLDYTSSNYLDVVSRLSSEYSTDSFSVVSRVNAINKLIGNEDRYSRCLSTPSLWFYVSGNGDVYACGAHVGNPKFLLGNIFSSSMIDIWQSDQRKECWSHVSNELDLENCRRTCRMDEANKYLYSLYKEAPPHVNFI